MQVLELLPYFSLAFGLLFFTYAIRYYLALAYTAYILFKRNGNNGNGNNKFHTNGGIKLRHNGHNTNGGTTDPLGNGYYPMVSIHIPLYNEEKVAARLMEALLSLDYPKYEVIVVDDSTDSTPTILRRYEKDPRVKIIHRKSRSGFKGGALREALKFMSDEAEYVVVFDADFIPPKDIIQRLLNEFGNGYENGQLNGRGIRKMLDELYSSREIVVVQGYQWHVLNASENWITKAVSAEYAGNYLVERLLVNDLMLGMRMISGSVFMIRADILRQYGWRDSLTEDWDLTLRLYRDGYKVKYTQLAAAPAECPATLMSLIRQRARWAEGHTFAVKRYFMEILRSKFLSLREKLEFLYLSPYYLSSLFLILGTVVWLVAEVLRVKIPFWTSIFGWSLLLTNMMAIPLVNLTGLYLEYRASRHWQGAFTFIPLMHVLATFQAMAALKGLFSKKESAWFRTLKTGKITEGIFAFIIRKIFRGRQSMKKRSGIVSCAILSFLSSFLAYALLKLLLTSIEGSGSRIPQPAEYAILMASISVGIATLVWLMGRSIRIGAMMPRLLISVVAVVSSYIPLRLLLGMGPLVLYDAASALASACLGVLLFYGSRFGPDSSMLRKAGILFVTTSLMLLVSFQPIQQAQAYVPYQTLYLYPNGGTTVGSGTMSTTQPSGSQSLSSSTYYYWRSESTYNFQDSDDGTWVFHFAGVSNKKGFMTGYVGVYVSPNTNNLGTQIGSGSFSGTYYGDFEEDVFVPVNLPTCTNCYIHLRFQHQSFIVEELPGGVRVVRVPITMYTGYTGKYTYLVIPENVLAFLPFALLLLLARRAYRKSRASSLSRALPS